MSGTEVDDIKYEFDFTTQQPESLTTFISMLDSKQLDIITYFFKNVLNLMTITLIMYVGNLYDESKSVQQENIIISSEKDQIEENIENIYDVLISHSQKNKENILTQCIYIIKNILDTYHIQTDTDISATIDSLFQSNFNKLNDLVKQNQINTGDIIQNILKQFYDKKQIIDKLLASFNTQDHNNDDLLNLYQGLLKEFAELKDIFKLKDDKESILKDSLDVIKQKLKGLQTLQSIASSIPSTSSFQINQKIQELWNELIMQNNIYDNSLQDTINKLKDSYANFADLDQRLLEQQESYLDSLRTNVTTYLADPNPDTLKMLLGVINKGNTTRSEYNNLTYETLMLQHLQKLHNAALEKNKRDLDKKLGKSILDTDKLKQQKEELETLQVDIMTRHNQLINRDLVFTDIYSELFNEYSEIDVNDKNGEYNTEYEQYISEKKTIIENLYKKFNSKIGNCLHIIAEIKGLIANFNSTSLKYDQLVPSVVHFIAIDLEDAIQTLESKTENNQLVRFVSLYEKTKKLLDDYESSQEFFKEIIVSVKDVKKRFVDLIDRLKKTEYWKKEINKKSDKTIFDFVDKALEKANDIQENEEFDISAEKIEDAFHSFSQFVVNFSPETTEESAAKEYQGGALAYDYNVGEHTIAFFSFAAFILSLLTLEHFVKVGIIPNTHIYIIPCFLVLYSILMSIITLAKGIETAVYVRHISSLYITTGLLYIPWSISGKDNKSEYLILIVWIISLWLSLCL